MQLKRRWVYLAATPVIFAAIPGMAWVATGRDTSVATDTATTDLRLVANLSEKRLRMFEADTLVWQYPIAVGQPSYPTPPGDYRIHKLTWNPRWTPPPGAPWAKRYKPQEPGSPLNPMRVVKIYFKEPDYYIHGTNDIRSLGNAESHGCLRMDPDHVAEVARFVMERGGQQREESWFWRILHFRNEEKTVYLTKPIPLTVEP